MAVITTLVAGLVGATGALVVAEPAAATYAEGGSGRHIGAIDWIEWGASGAPITNGTTATSTRDIAGQELTTTCTITDVVGSVAAYRSGDYSGDSLDDLYNIGGAGSANQMVYGLVNRDNGATVSFHFSCETRLNGALVPLGGLVVADAESSNRSQGEYVQAKPDEAATTWRVIERARSCDTNVLATLATDKTLRLHPDAEQCSSRQRGGSGPMAIGYMDGATGAAVTVKGGGKSAVALGVVLEADFGDAPESYGAAGALFERAWTGGEVPVGETNVSSSSFALATQSQPRTRLGAIVDSDNGHQFSAAADADDRTAQADEDAVAAIGSIDVTPGEPYVIEDVSCTGPGFVAAWIDWNRNGAFDDGERSRAVECVGSSVDLAWTVPMDAQDGASFARIRIAQTADGVASPVGMTTTGEVEDHALSIALPHLAIEKISDATADTRPGDTVTYTVRARNTGATAYTDAYPAVVFDDLSGVLDDAAYNDDARADREGDLAYAEPLLSWTGPLAAGDAVEITYTTTVKAGGDGTARNVAWEPNDPENPATPSCDPADGGVDPTTGEPCAEAVHLLPKLKVVKTAVTEELPAVGETATFRIELTNVGPGAFTAEEPARVEDDLVDVLDDAVFGTATSDVDPQPVFDGERYLTWQGALASGRTVTIEYTVDFRGTGDNVLRNTACVPEADTASGAPSCDFAQIPAANLTWWKTVKTDDDPVVAGSTLEYTLWFANDGEADATVDAVDHLVHVLDDARVTVEPSSDTLTVVRDGDRIAITGTVPPGATVPVRYTVTVKPDGQRGDDIAANFLLPAGEEPPTEPVCEPDAARFPDCTTTPIAAVEYAKSVTASTDPVGEGTVLTYEITVTGTGETTAPVAREDDLSGVLDDADLTTQPSSDTESVTVTEVQDGRFAIGGTIGAGKTATITYTVTVRAAAERGDHRADNFLMAPGETPSTSCESGDDCTSTPMPAISAAKSADPATGETVVAGQRVTYTLEFRNDGTAAGGVDYVDDLSGVLDDAALVDDPSSAVLDAVIDGDALRVSGTLEPRQVTTVAYTVEVGQDGARGDNRLANVLAPSDLEEPSCDDALVSCTEHPVPELASWKSVEASATPVAAGTELTYTLHFENTGEAPASVDEVDHLVHVLDDADVTVEPTAGALTAIRDGDTIAITGEVAPRSVETVMYTVTVKADGERGDDIAANFLLPAGEEPPTEPTCQPADGEHPDCTVTPIGRLLTGKAVEASSDPIVTGTELTYTLTFDNQGEGPATVAHIDRLADVLDDATLSEAPVASDDALQVTEVLNGAFAITGELAAGQVVTVRYTVVVNAEGERGNDVAANFLVPSGEEPPATCDGADCTVTPIGRITAEKSADPASDTAVDAGDRVTYTLSFANDGQAATAVDWTDSLADVLDDAELVEGPTADGLTAVLDGDVLHVTGTLDTEATATVTYTVEVRPYDEQGDHTLANHLTRTGEEPPAVCDPDSRLCTEHPTVTPTPEPTPEPTPTDPAPEPTPEPTPTDPAPEPTPEPTPTDPAPEPTPEPTPTDPAPEPTPEPTPTDPAPQPTPEPMPTDPAPEPTPEPSEPAEPEPTDPAPQPSEPAEPEPSEPAEPAPSDPADPAPSAPADPTPAPQPEDDGSLSPTGVSITVGALLAALVAAAGGAALMVVRRRRERDAA
ncbi:CshA/CshB family fibrillar adhesin-related protein [Microbacterium sp. SA156]|uniref:CshA/CshB family fibrillar adhesin-related protein n=1 Tax=Microbacterium TaxID=33882 RepID=UPI003B9DD9BE